jgi:hypothetical protein
MNLYFHQVRKPPQHPSAIVERAKELLYQSFYRGLKGHFWGKKWIFAQECAKNPPKNAQAASGQIWGLS